MAANGSPPLRETRASAEIWRWHEEAHLADGLARTSGARPRVPLPLERRLVVAATQGDAAARARLIEAFLPSVAGVARRYRASPAVNRGELMQAGVVGLLRALQRYEVERGTPFWAYASWWVREAMQEVVAELTRPVILSDRALRQLARVKGARTAFLQEHAREPSPADLVEPTGLPREQIERLIAADRPPRGLAEPLGSDDDGSGTVGELLADPAAEEEYQRLFRRLEAEDLRGTPVELGRRERVVLRARFGIGCGEHTLQEIATELRVSAERVRQIEQQALGKLRSAAEAPPEAARPHGATRSRRRRLDYVPPADVLSSPGQEIVRLDVPGVTEEMLQLRLESDVLTIRGERPAPRGGRPTQSERPRGRFERALSVPAGMGPDAIEASLDRGVLTVRIPAPAPRRPGLIAIYGTSSGPLSTYSSRNARRAS